VPTQCHLCPPSNEMCFKINYENKSAQCILKSAQCILKSAQCILKSAQCILKHVGSTLVFQRKIVITQVAGILKKSVWGGFG